MTHPTLHNIKSMLRATAAAAALGATLAACGDTGDPATGETQRVNVLFTMSVSNTAATSRALNEGWDDYNPTAPGTADENAINADDIKIKVCDNSGNVIGSVSDVRMTQYPDSETLYYVTGAWDSTKDLVARARKVTVLANCGDAANADDIAAMTYDIASTSKYIPMWGVAPFEDLVQDKSGDTSKAGTVDMLRAMAKVSVSLRSDMAERGYTITKLTLNHLNAQGYCAPKTYNTVSRTADIRFDGSLNPLTVHPTPDWRDFTASAVTYIPEYSNANPNDRATITVTLSRGGTEEGTYTLSFCNYDNTGAPTGTYYDIQRNHHYQYTIYKESDDIGVTLKVVEWNRRDHTEIIM